MYGMHKLMIDQEKPVKDYSKIRMDQTVLKQEIIKMFKLKSEYTAKELIFYFKQPEGNVKKALRAVANCKKVAPYKHIYTLKSEFESIKVFFI